MAQDKSLFSFHPYWWLWTATLVSIVGDVILFQALIFQVGRAVVDDRLASTLEKVLSAEFQVYEYIPFFVLAPVVGTLVDRFPLRRILIVSDLCRVVLVLCLFGMSDSLQDIQTYKWVLLLLGVFACLFSPAKIALLAQLVTRRQLMPANAFLSSAAILANAFGVALAASLLFSQDMSEWLMTRWGGRLGPFVWQEGPQMAFDLAIALDALTFLLSAFLLFCLSVDNRRRRIEKKPLSVSELMSGFSLLVKSRDLKIIALACLSFWSLAGMFKTCLPEFARDVCRLQGMTGSELLHAGTELQGQLFALTGVGILLGVGLVAWAGQWIHFHLSVALSAVATGLCLALFLLVDSPFMLSLTACLLGVFAGTLVGRNDADVVLATDEVHRGRVLAAKGVVFAMALVIPNAFVMLLDTGYVSFTAAQVLWMVLSLFAVCCLVFVLTCLQRFGLKRLLSKLVFFGARCVMQLMLKCLYRIRVTGLERVPDFGACIVCANHVSYLDPLFVQLVTHRQIHFLTWDQVVNKAPRLFKLLGAFAVSDEGDNTRTIRQSLTCLREGRVLGIFPEGGLGSGEDLQPLKEGAAILANQAQCPVIPVYLRGANQVYPKGGKLRLFEELTIEVGFPITAGTADRKIQTEDIALAIRNLQEGSTPEADFAHNGS